ncbi:MAG: RNA-binding protein [Ruminobacter sp.]|nr:RNA-binding protein [Ruminobacter sp.]
MAKSSSKQYLKSCYVAFVLSLAYFTVLKVTALNLELTFIIFSTISVLIVGMLTPLTFVFSGKIVTDEIENARPDETPINIPPAIKKRHISSNDMRNNVFNRKQSSEHHYTHNATVKGMTSDDAVKTTNDSKENNPSPHNSTVQPKRQYQFMELPEDTTKISTIFIHNISQKCNNSQLYNMLFKIDPQIYSIEKLRDRHSPKTKFFAILKVPNSQKDKFVTALHQKKFLDYTLKASVKSN